MLSKRLIPCLLIESGKLVKTSGFKTPKYAPCPLLVNMVMAGKLGVKSAEGFYDYSNNRKAVDVAKMFC